MSTAVPSEGVRWGRGRWLVFLVVMHVGLAASLAALAGAISALWSQSDSDVGTVLYALFAAVGGQAVLMWGAVRRLRDLGRPSDDVLWLPVPVVGTLAALQLLARTPAPEVRERRIRAWSRQLTAWQAWRLGVSDAVGAWPAVLVASAGLGAVVAAGTTVLADSVVPIMLAPQSGLPQAASALALALLVYAAVHIAAAARRSVASWWPLLFVLPALAVAAPGFFPGAGSSTRPLFAVGVIETFEASVASLVAGALLARVLAADDARHGRASTGRMADVAVAFALRAQLLAVSGFPLIVPAVWFSVSFALADVLTWDAASVVRSRQDVLSVRDVFGGASSLVTGVRSKILKVLLLWFGSMFVLSTVAQLLVVSPEVVVAGATNAADLPPAAVFVSSSMWMAVTCVAALALRRIQLERVALRTARDASAAPVPASGA